MLNFWNETDLNQTLAFMDDVRRRMDRVLGDLDPFFGAGERAFQTPEALGAGRGAWPRIAVRDEGTKYVVVALLPGVKESDLNVSLHDDLITLSASRTPMVPEGYKALRTERAPFEMTRTITVPSRVDPDRTSAELKDGVLTLVLEKAAEAQPRQISVKAS